MESGGWKGEPRAPFPHEDASVLPGATRCPAGRQRDIFCLKVSGQKNNKKQVFLPTYTLYEPREGSEKT